MPRNPIDYSKSVFYKIVCKDITITDLYVGSTTDFKARKYQHKRNCQNEDAENYFLKVYQFIRGHGGFENWDMILIYRKSCIDSHEAHSIERGYIETLGATLNCVIPTRTMSEWAIDHKEGLQAYRADYYDINRDAIIIKAKIHVANNKEHTANYQKTYQENNKDKIKQYKALYHKRNRDAILEKQRLYRANNNRLHQDSLAIIN